MELFGSIISPNTVTIFLVMEVIYNKSNQVLVEPDFGIYQLYSYNTLVLEIVDGKQTINAKTGLNYHGRRSVTTSKHITQALRFLGLDN